MLTLHTHIKCQNYVLNDYIINVTHTYIHLKYILLFYYILNNKQYTDNEYLNEYSNRG